MIFSFKFEFKRRLYLNIAALTAILLTLRNVSFTNLVIPGIECLILLLSIKFLEEKRFRDYMEIYTLSVLSAAGYSLLSINIGFIPYILLLFYLLSIATVFLTYFDTDENILLTEKEILKIAFKTSFIFLLSIPVSILIFFILPRIEYPFFDFLNNNKTALTGFSDKITLGGTSFIQNDNSVIFRAKMEKTTEENLYWRGAVLNRFNGKVWSRTILFRKTSLSRKSIQGYKLIKQTIYIEPYYGRYLFSIDKPIFLNLKNSQLDTSLTATYNKNIFKRMRYVVYSLPSEKIFQNKISLKTYLQIPKHLSMKVVNLSKKLRGSYDEQTVANIENFFIKDKLVYSLKNLSITENPVENFLFETKKGNCEYFASSFALILRLNGIPSRIVAGFRGGEYSPMGNYYIVRQKDAHVWVEAYINKYWIRIDPSNFAAKSTFEVSSLSNKKNGYNFKMLLDLINYYYIKLFINYDFNFQMDIVKSVSYKVKYRFVMKKFLKQIGLFFLCVAILFFIAASLNHGLTFRQDEKVLKQLLKIMEKKGYKRGKNETLQEFSERIKEKNLKSKVDEFIKLFNETFYKDKKFSKDKVMILRKIIDEIGKTGVH